MQVFTYRFSHTSCSETELPGKVRRDEVHDKTEEPLVPARKCPLQKENVLYEDTNTSTPEVEAGNSELKLSQPDAARQEKCSKVNISSNVVDQGWFSKTASVFAGQLSWRIRTFLVVICAAFYVVSNIYNELEYSSVVLIISVDLGYFMLIILQSKLSMSKTSTGLQTWVTLIKLTLSSYIPSQFSFFLDSLLLFLYLVLQMFRDVFLMLFVIVLLNSVIEIRFLLYFFVAFGEPPHIVDYMRQFLYLYVLLAGV